MHADLDNKVQEVEEDISLYVFNTDNADVLAKSVLSPTEFDDSESLFMGEKKQVTLLIKQILE